MKNIHGLDSQKGDKNLQKDTVKQGGEQNYYGRTYHETVPFTQANFEALQNILNQRNELLSTVKSHPLI